MFGVGIGAFSDGFAPTKASVDHLSITSWAQQTIGCMAHMCGRGIGVLFFFEMVCNLPKQVYTIREETILAHNTIGLSVDMCRTAIGAIF